MNRRRLLLAEIANALHPVRAEYCIGYGDKFYRPEDFDGISKPKRGAKGISWSAVGLKRVPPYCQFENCRVYFF